MSETTDRMAELLDKILVQELERLHQEKAPPPAALITAVLKRLESADFPGTLPSDPSQAVREKAAQAGLKLIGQLPPVDTESDDPATQ
jgi:hypothetical protein